jgi:hypothetical protein
MAGDGDFSWPRRSTTNTVLVINVVVCQAQAMPSSNKHSLTKREQEKAKEKRAV